MKKHIKEKQLELLYSLSEQEYSLNELGQIFGIPRSTVHHLLKQKPPFWVSPWVKRSNQIK
jgi:predicted DNA-binding protein YlxM (UPF0122 family)